MLHFSLHGSAVHENKTKKLNHVKQTNKKHTNQITLLTNKAYALLLIK